MASEVGSGQVAIYPTFKGFRRAVTGEVDGSTKAGASRFTRGFRGVGRDVGRTTGAGFSKGFTDTAKNAGSAALSKLKTDSVSAARAVSGARLKEQDAAGKVRVAEAALNEVRKKAAAGSSRLVAAEERAASAQRNLASAEDATKAASTRLTSAQKQLEDATSRAGNEATRSQSGFRRAGSAMTGLQTAGTGVKKLFAAGLGIAAGLAGFQLLGGAVDRAVGFFRESVQAASDLQQSVGGVDAIFGKSGRQIRRWARGAATSVGLSQNSYNELASVIGAQLKNAGTSMDKVGKKTNGLIKLGADLSATFGGSTKDAVEAVSSALKGERDPIERYGVSLNQARIDAEAANLGFKKVGGSFSTQASQAATLSLIYKQTSASSGQFAKQTDTLAEKQQIFEARLENVKAKVGTAFLPAISDMVGAISDSLDPALEASKPYLDGFAKFVGDTAKSASGSFRDLLSGKAFGDTKGLTTALQPTIDKLKDIPPNAGEAVERIGAALKKAMPDMVTFATVVGPPLVTVLDDSVTLAGQLAPAIGALSPVLVPLAGGFAGILAVSPVSMLRNTFDLMSSAQDPAQKLQGALTGQYGTFSQFSARLGIAMSESQGSVLSFVAVARIRFMQFQGNVSSSVGLAVARFQQGISQLPLKGAVALARVVRDVTSFGVRIGSIALTAGRALVNNFVSGIRARIGAVGTAVSSVMSKAADYFPHSPAKRGPFSGRGWTLYSGQATVDGFARGLTSRTASVRSASGTVMTAAALAGSSSAMPTISKSGTGGSDRPIYMDGSLFGMLRQMANGEATIVLNRQNADLNAGARLGIQGLTFG